MQKKNKFKGNKLLHFVCYLHWQTIVYMYMCRCLRLGNGHLVVLQQQESPPRSQLRCTRFPDAPSLKQRSQENTDSTVARAWLQLQAEWSPASVYWKGGGGGGVRINGCGSDCVINTMMHMHSTSKLRDKTRNGEPGFEANFKRRLHMAHRLITGIKFCLWTATHKMVDSIYITTQYLMFVANSIVMW